MGKKLPKQDQRGILIAKLCSELANHLIATGCPLSRAQAVEAVMLLHAAGLIRFGYDFDSETFFCENPDAVATDEAVVILDEMIAAQARLH